MDYLVSAPEMRELDRQTIEELKVPGRTLMEVAGRAVAEVCHDGLEGPARIAIVCGTGNNGGDGFVAARALMARGHDVHAFIIGDRDKLKGDAKSALEPFELMEPDRITVVDDAKDVWELADALDEADLAVDALLGTGLNAEVRGLIGEVIDVLNDADVPVVAVDIPSGVDADTGAVLGRAVEAGATVTFAFAKRGHYLYPGAELRGQLAVADIGIPEALAGKLGVVGRLIEAEDGPELLPRRLGGSHKGNYGHTVVLAGSAGKPGAAILALDGALRAGAGLVSWAADTATIGNAPPRPAEVMLRERGSGEGLDTWVPRLLDAATALVIGPGISTAPERVEELGELLGHCRVPICMDADGLNILAANPELWDRIEAPLVVTPHPKEMARLTSSGVESVQRDRVAAALQLAMTRECVVVLKGAGTVVAEPEGSATVIGAGNPGMATGGTGDVLAGVIGSFLAQGLEVSHAAELGALLHAAAGDEAAKTHGQAGLRATDIIDAMGGVLATWGR